MLAQAKLAWKETGFFDIGAEVAPGMNSAQAIKMGLELSKQQALGKKLVREGETQYLIKLKDIKSELTDLKAQDQSALENEKANTAYASWIDSFKKTAKIQTNSSLTKTQK